MNEGTFLYGEFAKSKKQNINQLNRQQQDMGKGENENNGEKKQSKIMKTNWIFFNASN